MENTRFPVAQNFYSGDCQSQIEQFIAGFEISENISDRLIGAVVPHAGWIYSGSTAAKTLYCLSQKCSPDSIVILGADHTGVSRHSVYPAGSWSTPLGMIEIDSELAGRIATDFADLVLADSKAHANEHSIEVLLPMVKYFWPSARVVPITVRPDASSIMLGKELASIIPDLSNIIFIASTDLTHYGAPYGLLPAGIGATGYDWLVNNDSKMISLILEGEPGNVLSESQENHNACGAGGVAALKAIMKSRAVKVGQLIDYSTSHGDKDKDEFDFGVGYAGIVF